MLFFLTETFCEIGKILDINPNSTSQLWRCVRARANDYTFAELAAMAGSVEGRGRLSPMPDGLNLSMTLRRLVYTYSSAPTHEITLFAVYFSLACSVCENTAHEYSDPLISRSIVRCV